MFQEYNHCAVQLWGQEPKRLDSGERYSGAHKLYLPNDTPLSPLQSPMAEVLRGNIQAVHDKELIIERPDGSKITVIVNVVPLKNEQEKITSAVCCFVDITERSRLERKNHDQAESLTNLDRRKDEFLAMLSHELRNPLAACPTRHICCVCRRTKRRYSTRPAPSSSGKSGSLNIWSMTCSRSHASAPAGFSCAGNRSLSAASSSGRWRWPSP